MVTLADIAAKCNVSISAVSLAINKPYRISKEQKEKILKVAHESGYFHKKHPKLEKVLLVFNNFHDCYFGEYYNKVVYGILTTLYSENIAIQILSDFDVVYSDVYESDGIIFVGKVPDEYIARADEFSIPYVLCGHPSPVHECYSLRFDIKRGVYEIIDYLVGCGHKKIALMLGESEDSDPIKKILINSYKAALIKNKVKPKEKYLAYANFSNLQTVEIALNSLLGKQNEPTAIFCTSDHFAYMSYTILKKWGHALPQDYSIVGFDGISIPIHLEIPKPVLTTVATDQILLGQEAVALLKKIIMREEISKKEQILPVNIQIGDSVKRLK